MCFKSYLKSKDEIAAISPKIRIKYDYFAEGMTNRTSIKNLTKRCIKCVLSMKTSNHPNKLP